MTSASVRAKVPNTIHSLIVTADKLKVDSRQANGRTQQWFSLMLLAAVAVKLSSVMRSH
jgi:hypothetical protein